MSNREGKFFEGNPIKKSLFDTYIVAQWARRVLVWNELHCKRSM